MYIPNYRKHRGWLRFFSGILIGTLIGWGFFLAEYGERYDHLYNEMGKQSIIINELRAKNDQLINDITLHNEENLKNLIVQSVTVNLTNSDKYHLSQLNVYELKQQILKELRHLQGTNIETIASIKEVILSAVENKTYTLNNNEYRVKTISFFAMTEMELNVEIIEEKSIR
ncbi:hypothetical protein CAY60_009675 [Shouchella clausii]|jgi:hypothetical protein|uniref:Sporulation membrane protein YtrI C-terminal domain-containing protein n=3 Tax=Shouchella TaxID=2893057 RepID=Q5WEE9_SHOC1|nr:MULTISPECIES: sporulation membrane protein YtrI [Shouchella]MCM3313459.1 hypothetical protein [Psychrobacillus sp. MER TA 17]PAD42550.1 hypothetical protein CHH54_11510 [Bacillus sp. 7520-S]SPU21929.1 sporulation protein [Niallia circulans]ALA54352.1 hypothetical protein DB29_03524 [Shouchella clausii]AST97001.1 hypothetical protein BC8716_14005 [Shouchella clausii]